MLRAELRAEEEEKEEEEKRRRKKLPNVRQLSRVVTNVRQRHLSKDGVSIIPYIKNKSTLLCWFGPGLQRHGTFNGRLLKFLSNLSPSAHLL